MDFVFWIIVIVLIVGVVWWLLNRSSSARDSGTGGQNKAAPSARPQAMRADGALAGGSAAASADAAATAGIPSAAGFGRPAEPVAPTTADELAEPAGAAVGMDTGLAPETAEAAAPDEDRVDGAATLPAREDLTAREDLAGQQEKVVDEDQEWETQWSEASGSPAGSAPVHHPEYTDPHSPTLPGAETAAVEDFGESTDQSPSGTQTQVPASAGTLPGMAPPDLPDNAPEAETMDRAQSSAVVETAASHAEGPEAAAGPAGHLAADEPYGQGSASPAPDGSCPAGYSVKGDAGSMVYYEEGHPDYEQTRAEVWFESAAHAEAAGFRAPRRTRP